MGLLDRFRAPFVKDECEKLIKYDTRFLEISGSAEVGTVKFSLADFSTEVQKIRDASEASQLLDNYQYLMCKICKSLPKESEEWKSYAAIRASMITLLASFQVTLIAFRADPASHKVLLNEIVSRIQNYAMFTKVKIPNLGIDLESKPTEGIISEALKLGALDQFGIPYLEDDSPIRTNWNQLYVVDNRLMGDKFIEVGNGWLAPENPIEFTLGVKSDPNVTDSVIPTFYFPDIIAKGYLYKPTTSPDGFGDSGNIEQTWRFKVVKTLAGRRDDEVRLELVAGGYKHDSSSNKAGQDRKVPVSCEAWSYHFNIYPLSGSVKFEKNSNHTSGYALPSTDPYKANAVSRFDTGQEVIQKAVLYRVPDSNIPGGFAMKLESYLDMTGKGQDFKKILEYLDNGNWGPTVGGNAVCCGGSTQYEFVVMNAARCVVSFRCYNMEEFLFRGFSVRSIDPTKSLHPSASSST